MCFFLILLCLCSAIAKEFNEQGSRAYLPPYEGTASTNIPNPAVVEPIIQSVPRQYVSGQFKQYSYPTGYSYSPPPHSTWPPVSSSYAWSQNYQPYPIRYTQPYYEPTLNPQLSNYKYGYFVSNPRTGDFKDQFETKDGNLIQGEYSLVQPDGILKNVLYTSDDVTGFKAIVKNYHTTYGPPKLDKTNNSCVELLEKFVRAGLLNQTQDINTASQSIQIETVEKKEEKTSKITKDDRRSKEDTTKKSDKKKVVEQIKEDDKKKSTDACECPPYGVLYKTSNITITVDDVLNCIFLNL